MDSVRNGERETDSDLVAILLDCKDHTAALVEDILNGEDGVSDSDLVARGEALINQLNGGSDLSGTSVVEVPDKFEKEVIRETPGDNWIISLQFGEDALRNGLDPLSFLRYLGTLGDIVEIITLTHTMPSAESMNAESCYLGFRIAFFSDADKTVIENVFEFAQDDCDVRILAPRSKHEHYLALLQELPEDRVCRLGEILVAIGAITEQELIDSLGEQGLSKDNVDTHDQAEKEHANKPLGEILIERKVVDKPVVEQALKKQERSRERASQEAKYIRVDSGKLGQLINLVGELVISTAAMKVQVERHSLAEVEEVASGVEHLVEEIRDNALQLRMVQIGDTFSRFRRVVRDVGKELGKEIELHISGGETELDKTVVEKINDPLTHLIRNALDHGIEAPSIRLEQGKPATGTVFLNAYHDSGHIVIQIKDDGAGLDPDKIKKKALSLGIIQQDHSLSRRDIFRLIFEAGLSTKQQASDLSGRGVGMDVVKRNIESLRGAIELDSELGQGTTVTIHLPLTLAIIDGFLVSAGGERYVIPLSMVVECVELDEVGCQINEDSNYVNLRGEVLPYLRLKSYFRGKEIHLEEPTLKRQRQSLVVVRIGQSKAGFVIDELYGELQTVIKPLGKVFQKLKGISGATVLGSGEVALILDVKELIKQVSL
jgi:two-component system chemotaxis sensor kinase CheA